LLFENREPKQTLSRVLWWCKFQQSVTAKLSIKGFSCGSRYVKASGFKLVMCLYPFFLLNDHATYWSSVPLVTWLIAKLPTNQSFSPEIVRECRNHPLTTRISLLERNETRRVRSTDTRSAVLDRFAVSRGQHHIPNQLKVPLEKGQPPLAPPTQIEKHTMRWRTQPGSGRPFRA
jgi:hypothetical protein